MFIIDVQNVFPVSKQLQLNLPAWQPRMFTKRIIKPQNEWQFSTPYLSLFLFFYVLHLNPCISEVPQQVCVVPLRKIQSFVAFPLMWSWAALHFFLNFCLVYFNVTSWFSMTLEVLCCSITKCVGGILHKICKNNAITMTVYKVPEENIHITVFKKRYKVMMFSFSACCFFFFWVNSMFHNILEIRYITEQFSKDVFIGMLVKQWLRLCDLQLVFLFVDSHKNSLAFFLSLSRYFWPHSLILFCFWFLFRTIYPLGI